MKYSFLYFRRSFKMLIFNFKLVYILTGLYTFIVGKCDAGVEMKCRRKVYSALYITVLCVITTACLIQRLALLDDNVDLLKYSYASFCSCVNLIGQVTIISFAYKADKFVDLVNRMDEFDKKLKKLRVVISNTVPFWMIICHILVIPIYMYAFYIADRSLEKKLLDMFSVIIPITTRCTIICTLTAMLTFLLQRCHGINLFLEVLDDSLLEDNMNDSIMNVRKRLTRTSEQEATKILNNVTELLEQLVEFTELIKNIFAVIIFINFAFFILALALILVWYMYYEILTYFTLLEYFIMAIIYAVHTLELYILCFLLETETKNIYITMGQLNIYYLTPKLAFMKNTLLLQGLHNKVDMNLFGMIPLRPSIFLKQLDVCKTIMLLILQYYQRSQRK